MTILRSDSRSIFFFRIKDPIQISVLSLMYDFVSLFEACKVNLHYPTACFVLNAFFTSNHQTFAVLVINTTQVFHIVLNYNNFVTRNCIKKHFRKAFLQNMFIWNCTQRHWVKFPTSSYNSLCYFGFRLQLSSWFGKLDLW